ncbi:UDP-3-O-(3-hydroxymyristoyl) N-acetylglucosamine deacetylase [[Leptolyngbya] sp. PCC 7376]|uniref:UDP-3-O-acyl-N-acetylglucosamine deacetylase n=1 Tax=[Leptolyngbya] sp. PCC 7376 TaxID=111781 RepID=UPI00029F44FF|nr:UDP-3-O-acyl-N-acetylglucosamine deacetylase [[Leptolyngbya] sp. PCC 7376]AFY39317.1 UDP-3-O-(3-hydroxymyristoyl) N-acetylglucosamine deacetylase [[Leptolyngbya] sp. PCC 7376]
MATTLKTAVTCSGIGLHSGKETTVKLMPCDRLIGRYFVRTDLADQPEIRAQIDAVGQTMLSTELGVGGVTIRTTEHLLAALTGLGVDHARIEISGAELPLLDGSAKDWAAAIASAGIQTISSESSESLVVSEPIWIREGDTFVAALPSEELRFSYGIDFPYKPIGNQWHSWSPVAEPFEQAIAPARTFGFADQIEQLQKAGLIQGGSLENALVCDHEKWINPPLRYDNEPARHKLLDLIGDLSLLGTIPTAHYLAYKASHKLHTQLAKQLAILGNT